MDNHDDKIVKLVGTKDLSIISTGLKLNNFIDLPLLFKKYNAKVYCAVLNSKMAKSMYNFMLCKEGINCDEIGFDIGEECYLTDKTKIVYSTYDVMIKLLLNNNFTFCNIIVLDELYHYSLEYEVFLYLWLHCYKECVLPKLVISLSSNYIPYLPVDISNSTYVINNNILNDDNIKYDDKNKMMDTDYIYKKIEKLHTDNRIGKDDISTWIVYLWDDISIDKIKNKLKELKDLDFLVWDNKLVYNQKGKRLIILSKHNINYIIPNVDGIIDSTIEVYKNISMVGGNNYITNSVSKSNAINRSYLKSGFIYRMCTKNYFNNLNKYIQTELDRVDLTDMFICLCKHNIDVYQLFKNRLNKKIIDRFMYPIREYDILDIKLFDYGLHLSVYNTIFLNRWITEKEDIFTGIVLSCILNLKHSIFNNITITDDLKGKDTMQIYMNICVNYFKEKTKPGNLNKYFDNLHKKIDNIFFTLSKYMNINKNDYFKNLNPDEINNEINKMKMLAKNIYKYNICEVVNGNIYLNKYTNTNYKLCMYKHPTYKEASNKIISLNSIVTLVKKGNKKRDKKNINFYINL